MFEMSKDTVKGTTGGFANVSVTSYRKRILLILKTISYVSKW